MIRNPLSRVRLVYRRSSLLMKCVVLTTILLSTAALTSLRLAIADAQSQTDGLRQQAAALEQENNRLEQDISELDTVEGIRHIASEELGLVDPDTVFFTPIDPD